MLIALVVVLLAVQCAVVAYGFRRIRRVARTIAGWRDDVATITEQSFRQFEALHALYVDLQLDHSLAPTRGWAASPDFLLHLARHALAARPRVILECGSGVSTVVLARCARLNGQGKVYSLEHHPEHAQRTRDELQRHGLTDVAEIVDAPLQPMAHGGAMLRWYNREALAPAGPVDMLVVDGPPGSDGPLARYPAGPALFPLLAAGAVVFVDDANRPDEMAALERWRKEFPELIQSVRDCEKGCVVLRKEHSGPSNNDVDTGAGGQAVSLPSART